MSRKGALSWLDIGKTWRGLLPSIATEIQNTEPDIGPKACRQGKCATMTYRKCLSYENIDEMMSYQNDVDVEALTIIFKTLKEENNFAYGAVMMTPHIFLENVGICRAVLVVKSMTQYILPFHQNTDIQQDEQCPESNFATYCYTAAKAFAIYNSNTQRDIEIVANFISAIVYWEIRDCSNTMQYPETTGSILNANDGRKCYRCITINQADTILERINGQALHKTTLFSAELIDSITELSMDDETMIDSS